MSQVNLYGIFYSNPGSIVMEFATNGDLAIAIA
jgi:hypothetical protein